MADMLSAASLANDYDAFVMRRIWIMIWDPFQTMLIPWGCRDCKSLYSAHRDCKSRWTERRDQMGLFSDSRGIFSLSTWDFWNCWLKSTDLLTIVGNVADISRQTCWHKSAREQTVLKESYGIGFLSTFHHICHPGVGNLLIGRNK